MRAGGPGCTLLIMAAFLYAVSCPAQPGGEDRSNVVITSSVEQYAFAYSRSARSVEVKQETVNRYTCSRYRDRALFTEFFDDQSTLDAVEYFQNGQKAYAGRELSSYSIENIFYSDAKVYRLPLDFPKSGWQNEVRLKKTIKDPRYFTSIYFSEPYAVQQKEVVLSIPRWMKAEVKEYNFEGYAITREQHFSPKEDADIIKYTVRNLPERKAERNQPGPSWYLPHLLVLSKTAEVAGQQFVYFNTLKNQYDWYRQVVGLTRNDRAIVAAKAAEITARATTGLDKVKAVLYWVHDNIRYIAFEEGIAGFKPDEAQNVLQKRYGDCKGMANLTTELLRSLGFDARLAWIGTNHIAYDYATPSLCVDNHMICCLIYKGQKYFLDGTESYLPLENYAERIQGRQVLVADGDNYLLERIPLKTYEQNRSHFGGKLQVLRNALSGTMEYTYRGESKEQFLYAIHNAKKEQVSLLLEQYLSNNNKNFAVSSVATSDLSQVDEDLSVSFRLDHAGAVSSFGNELYIDMDDKKFFSQETIDTAERKCDYLFPYKYNYQTDMTLEIPEGYKLSSVPSSFEFVHPDFRFSISYTVENNAIRYRKQLCIINTLLKKNAFPEWNKAVKLLTSRYLDQVVLAKINP